MPSLIIWDQVSIPPKTESSEGPGKFKTVNLPVLSTDDLNTINSSWNAKFGRTMDNRYLLAFADYFFAQFYPYVSNGFYQGSETDFIESGPSIARRHFFNQKLTSSLIAWGQTFNTGLIQTFNSSQIMNYVNQFAQFLEGSSNETIQRIRQIQQNVIMYCLDRLLDTMVQTQETEYRYSLDTNKYYEAMRKAQTGLEKIDLPTVKPSLVDARIPDPESVAAQQESLLEREKKRQSFNISKDKSRQIETNLQFSKENTKQFEGNFLSLFERQKTILEVLIRF